MTNIALNTIGRIVAGEGAGSYVKVIDDSANTGGFLILTSSDPTLRSGFDDWVAGMDDLLRYVVESRWVIEWDAPDRTSE